MFDGNVYKERFDRAFYNQERLNDFIEFLFETELENTTRKEMWDKFIESEQQH